MSLLRVSDLRHLPHRCRPGVRRARNRPAGRTARGGRPRRRVPAPASRRRRCRRRPAAQYADVSGSVRLHGDELLGRSDADMSHPGRFDRHRVPGPDVGADAGLHRRRPDRRKRSRCTTGRWARRRPAGGRSNCSNSSASSGPSGARAFPRLSGGERQRSSSPSPSPTTRIC